MLTLAFIGLVGGLITGVSPCVLPMLPIIFFAGTAGKPTPQQPRADGDVLVEEVEIAKPRRDFRPLKIIAGIVVSFSIFTLAGSVILSALGLPDSFLRWGGLTVLTLVGLGLIFPALGHWIEKPFYRLPKINRNDNGAFVLGLGLGTLYVPCAGPVLAAITVAGATGNVGWRTVVLTVSFAIGAALPLLIFASAGSRISQRVKAYRDHQRAFRIGGGIVMILLAIALAFNITDVIQRSLPSYTSGLEKKVAENKTVQGVLAPALGKGGQELAKCTPGAAELATCGAAPEFTGTQKWFNTPGGKPVTIAELKGKVVLVDFWAYSCINCQRATPHLLAWAKAYQPLGLQIVGIHSPEFAFEKSAGNVEAAIRKEGITYPVGQDNNLATWTEYRNQYWPAKYLIDADGAVRAIKFGEGSYAQVENQIRQLLKDADPNVQLPAPVDGTVQADTVGAAGTTPETYLGYSRSTNLQGAGKLTPNKTVAFGLNSAQPDDTFSLGGSWQVGTQSVTSTKTSQSRLNFNAAKVFHVLSGEGTVKVSIPGLPDKTVKVSGTPNAYQLADLPSQQRHTMTVTYTPGLSAFTYSFG
ncbi:cytochrome c biogenesis protein CcdA [Kribbella sandramycini]|uniref:Cytochrome c biogenesis protein CcdA/thiol-disulfide isomerase/thioredoxin n=1 Tax=Kribbella sandramycini TaxID=60450 RepID=A0A841S9W9_9ACTN|nr:cytochrome c biogenesis protein CcdA [Kribbella sandramycini]MBB6568898.1 cytochrome c biogenesis protein CcdA/thiol-disulfide isomerase/thioredoxin [Kribbella sandramycini]